MRGPFGGLLETGPGKSRETVTPGILRWFTVEPAAGGDAAPRSSQLDGIAPARIAGEPRHETQAREVARSIGFRSSEGSIEYDTDLSERVAFRLDDDTETDVRIATLSAICERVAVLHEQGRMHGDLRPAMLGWCDSTPSLLVCDLPVDPRALLRERLASGAAPSDVGFVAPEVLEGTSASSASDVFSLAALTYAALARRPPLGLIDATDVFAPLGQDAVELLGSALSPDPSQRPDARALALALAEAKEPARRNESMLGAVLVAGGVAVFTGILGLAVTQFAGLGDVGKLWTAFGTTFGILLAGAVLMRRGSERTGIGLMTVASQLAWADAYLLLGLWGVGESHVAWALAGFGVGVFQATLAARFSSRVMGAFAAVAFLVSAVTLGLLLPSGSIGSSLYAAAVGVVYLGAAHVVAKLDAPALARPLHIAAGTATFASVALSLPALRDHALWSFAWPYLIAVVSLAFGARFLGVGIAVLAPTLQALVLFDLPETPHVAALGTLALAFAIHWKFGSEPLRRLACSIAAAWSLASLVASLVALSRQPDALVSMRHVATPYLLALGHLATRRVDHRRVASALVSLALISHAVSFRDSIGPVALAVVFGLIVIALSSRAKDVQNERLLLTVGLSASAVAPAAVALAARGSWSRLALSLLAATAMLAIALGRFRPRRAENRQAIEVSSLGVAGGVPLLLSLPNARSDIALSALTLAVGVVFLAIAVWRKRLLLSAATTALLLGVIGIQYFAKLSQAFHWGLLCVGFGFVLLTLAVLHERKLKSVWPKLERWER